MAHTKWGRIIVGGLLAGLVINLVGYLVNGILLENMWNQAMLALGRPPEFAVTAIVFFDRVGFLLGIGAVWLYAAMRQPRYGAGLTTAVRAGVAVWFFGYLLPNALLILWRRQR